jgi:hypothetical protein
LHENPRGTVDGAGACDRPGLRQVLELKRPSGEKNRLGISLTLYCWRRGPKVSFTIPVVSADVGSTFHLPAASAEDGIRTGFPSRIRVDFTLPFAQTTTSTLTALVTPRRLAISEYSRSTRSIVLRSEVVVA